MTDTTTLRSDFAATLRARLASRTATVAVIGQGYVGLPLAMHIGQAGFSAIGFDVSQSIVGNLNNGISHIPDVRRETIACLREAGRYEATADPERLADCDVVVVCVPTPLHADAPDLSYVKNAGEMIGRHLAPGALVILESTTYPGTTEEVLLPLIVSDTRTLGESFFLAFSPERIDPGNKTYTVHNTPKVVGGADEASGDLASAFYGTFINEVIRVPGTREAEMAKLIENTFRHVNIALVNELAVFCQQAGIDVNAAIRAAATKPFGFMAFYPGPGVGGHCIPVDPNYLAWQFRQSGERFRLVEAAEEINSHMPHHVVRRVQSILNERAIPLNGARVLIVGVAYKPDINDWRESPAIPIIELLAREHVDVTYIDHYVPVLQTAAGTFESTEMGAALGYGVDCAVIVTPHSGVDYQSLVENCLVVYDTRAFLPAAANVETL